MTALAGTYLAFLNHMQKPDGSFHNYLSYERGFLDVDGSEDCMGRALWSCGSLLNSNLPSGMKMVAKDIFDRGLACVWKSVSLRIQASAILGLSEYNQAHPNSALKADAGKLADSLVQSYKNQATEDWRWFEPHLTYDNNRLPQALFAAYRMTGSQEHLQVAEESMDFLIKTQMVDGVFVPIGNDGWYKRGEKRALYDQQPLEAAAMVDSAVEAYYATKNDSYVSLARRTFEWFLGKNSRNVVVYDAQTGGCCDGICAETLNANEGAESSVSYLLTRLKVEELNDFLKG